jgi:hypothetical protein
MRVSAVRIGTAEEAMILLISGTHGREAFATGVWCRNCKVRAIETLGVRSSVRGTFALRVLASKFGIDLRKSWSEILVVPVHFSKLRRIASSDTIGSRREAVVEVFATMEFRSLGVETKTWNRGGDTRRGMFLRHAVIVPRSFCTS